MPSFETFEPPLSKSQVFHCSSYGRTFDGKGEWSFYNDYPRNVIIFVVDNSLSSHADNHKNKLLILDEGDTFGINGSFGAPENV